ncbi:MAG TPA: PKD domain-containing protein [Candidatus Thermoplasmatota archaeon]
MARLLAAAVTLLVAVSATGCVGGPANAAPSASARIEPEGGGVVGQEITFIGAGHDGDGSVVRYEWDFGDGAPLFVNATRAATVHTFAQPGLFVAVFRACDDDGACGEHRVNVTIATGLAIAVNWTGENGYTVRGSPSLDAALLRVTLQAEGAQPSEFAVGAGLEPLGAGAYGAALPPATLSRGKATTATVFYNGSQVATRTAVAHPFAGSAGESDLRYRVEEREAGPFGIYDATTASEGEEVWLVAGGFIGHAFVGTGWASLTEVAGGTRTASNQTYSSLTWNETWGRYDPTLRQVDFRAAGTAVIEVTDAGGFRTLVHLSDYAATVVDGNLTSLRADGTGGYEGGLPNTAGLVNYTASSSGSSTATTGDGETLLALLIDENVTYAGTLGGAAYSSVNLSQRLTAAHDRYFPADFWVAWNDTTQINSTTVVTSGSRYLDSDGDGDLNPDLRPAFPSDGRVFAGLVPGSLALGDRVAVTNMRGDRAVLAVTATSPTIIVASGFQAQAVTAAQLTGSFGDPGAPGSSSGALSYSIVAEGPQALLWLSGGEHLALGGRTFDRALTLLGRP